MWMIPYCCLIHSQPLENIHIFAFTWRIYFAIMWKKLTSIELLQLCTYVSFELVHFIDFFGHYVKISQKGQTNFFLYNFLPFTIRMSFIHSSFQIQHEIDDQHMMSSVKKHSQRLWQFNRCEWCLALKKMSCL